MNYHKIEKTSIANGKGIRVVLWVSGCTLHCKGCHNPETWDFNSGKLFDEKAKQELFKALDKSYIQGITLSGGHPLEDENLLPIFYLTKEIKQKYPTKDIWIYTGYTLKDNHFDDRYYWDTTEKHWYFNSLIHNILRYCDVVVDGAYCENLRDITLPFRGSSNQRIIDVKKSIKNNKITLYQNKLTT